MSGLITPNTFGSIRRPAGVPVKAGGLSGVGTLARFSVPPGADWIPVDPTVPINPVLYPEAVKGLLPVPATKYWDKKLTGAAPLINGYFTINNGSSYCEGIVGGKFNPANTGVMWFTTDVDSWGTGAVGSTVTTIGTSPASGDLLFDIAYAATPNRSVGAAGQAFSSSGLTAAGLSTAASPPNASKGVAYGNSIFVVVENGNNMYTSTNGTTWTLLSPYPFAYSVSSSGRCLVFWKGKFWCLAAAGAAGSSSSTYLYSSTNGTTWTLVTGAFTSLSASDGTLRACGNRLVIVGTGLNGQNNPSYIYTSYTEDGSSWFQIGTGPGGATAYNDITWEPYTGVWLISVPRTSGSYVVNDIYISKDGYSWFIIDTTETTQWNLTGNNTKLSIGNTPGTVMLFGPGIDLGGGNNLIWLKAIKLQYKLTAFATAPLPKYYLKIR